MLRVRQSLLGRMRLQTQPVKKWQQLATVPSFVREGSGGTGVDSHHCHCPGAKGNQTNTQTVTLREHLENSPSCPVTKCHRPSQKYLVLMYTTSLNYLNGQNKTATYLWPFTSSSVTETHILLTHSSRLPQIHENLFPLHGREDMKMRTFNPMQDQSEDTAPGFQMPKFGWASASPLHFTWTFRMSLCLFSSVQMRNERVVRTGHLSMSLLIL